MISLNSVPEEPNILTCSREVSAESPPRDRSALKRAGLHHIAGRHHAVARRSVQPSLSLVSAGATADIFEYPKSGSYPSSCPVLSQRVLRRHSHTIELPSFTHWRTSVIGLRKIIQPDYTADRQAKPRKHVRPRGSGGCEWPHRSYHHCHSRINPNIRRGQRQIRHPREAQKSFRYATLFV